MPPAKPKSTAVSADRPFGDLSGKRALVTGASSGIGRAIALELARGGADVIVHYAKSHGAAREVVEQIRGQGRRGESLKLDLSKESRLADFVERAWERLEGIDIWVNNAGADVLTGGRRKLPYEQKLKTLWEVDVRAAALLSRMAGRRMAEEAGGVILNIGWDQADRGMEGDSGEMFGLTKNAIMGVTRSLAVTLAPKVRVNCIAPGWIRTAWGRTAPKEWQDRVLRETPLRRWGEPEDIARLARFLVSDDAAYITGQVVNANGGAVR